MRTMFLGSLTFACVSALSQHALAQNELWRQREAASLHNHVQLTFDNQFNRAGEAYFSPDGAWIIFQAIPTPAPDEPADENYSMYVGRLSRDDAGKVVGLETPQRLSPPGSANTCGYFDPSHAGRVIFGSTLTAPVRKDSPGYKRATGRYAWAFPEEMEIVSTTIDGDENAGVRQLRKVWSRPGYDAECSFSPNGRFILHTRVDPATDNPDLWVWDTRTSKATPLIEARGYDGGPFFSPDGKRICYRSDRKGDNLLQLYVSDLVFDADTGAIIGATNEKQVTDNEHVNWAPYWDPTGTFLIYATSEISHDNYELFTIEAPVGASAAKAPSELVRRRITNAAGFDGLPVISPDGALLMWTSQRVAGAPDKKGASQIWLAEIVNIAP